MNYKNAINIRLPLLIKQKWINVININTKLLVYEKSINKKKELKSFKVIQKYLSRRIGGLSVLDRCTVVVCIFLHYKTNMTTNLYVMSIIKTNLYVMSTIQISYETYEKMKCSYEIR